MNSSEKKIVVIGATGLIGYHFVLLLKEYGYNLVALSRNTLKAKVLFDEKIQVARWDGDDSLSLVPIFNNAFAVINLAGGSIAVRWTKRRKESIYKSRISTTRLIVEAINRCSKPPQVLIQASAIGFYPFSSELQFDEESACGDGFLANLVSDWERTASGANTTCRLVIIRTGIVLSSNGGFLKRLTTPTRFFLGGWFGDGQQKISWIHIDDHVKALKFLMECENCYGVFNLVSPNPISFKQLAKVIGSVMKRPIWFPIPKLILKILFGKMADEMVFSNQNVIPKNLLDKGFVFSHFEIGETIESLLKRDAQKPK